MKRTLFNFFTIKSEKNSFCDINVENLAKIWRGQKLFSSERKLITAQLEKIFAETASISELNAYRRFLIKGSKLDSLLNQAILKKTLEQISLSTDPVETYQMMVDFINNNEKSIKDKSRVHQKTLGQMEAIRKMKDFTSEQIFQMQIISDILRQQDRLTYPVVFKKFK